MIKHHVLQFCLLKVMINKHILVPTLPSSALHLVSLFPHFIIHAFVLVVVVCVYGVVGEGMVVEPLIKESNC
uniref:Uncharacterized protein n=1 Tax=Octopus bimaculoides TaxID=37653 RepID=A0A0L8G9N6_OCTBM